MTAAGSQLHGAEAGEEGAASRRPPSAAGLPADTPGGARDPRRSRRSRRLDRGADRDPWSETPPETSERRAEGSGAGVPRGLRGLGGSEASRPRDHADRLRATADAPSDAGRVSGRGPWPRPRPGAVAAAYRHRAHASIGLSSELLEGLLTLSRLRGRGFRSIAEKHRQGAVRKVTCSKVSDSRVLILEISVRL